MTIIPYCFAPHNSVHSVLVKRTGLKSLVLENMTILVSIDAVNFSELSLENPTNTFHLNRVVSLSVIIVFL